VAENPRIEDLRRRLEKEPGSRIFAQLAEELRKEGDFAEAIRVSRAGLAQHPTYPSARMTLGRALFDSGDNAAARGEFEAVLRGAPDNILASRLLAESLEAMGDLGPALMQYRAALLMAPGDRFLEVQIRALEQKLTPPPRPTEASPAARGQGPAAARPASGAEAAPPPAGLPPGFEPSAPTILLSGGAPARRLEPVAAAPPARSAPPAPPAAPLRAPAPPRVVPAAPAAREEGFEMEAPFDGRRLLAPEPASRRSLEFDDNLEAVDATLEGPLDAAIDRRAEASTGRRPLSPEPPALAPPLHLPPLLAAPAPEPGRVAGGVEHPPLSSSTLAELYLGQGFVDKAIEVYRQLLQREPGNEQARARMGELAALLATSPPGSPVIPVPPGDAPREDRAARRRDIERTIARLEELLATVRRHAPAGGAR
jgi:tetratricopeptide (TPR) repeat protein